MKHQRTKQKTTTTKWLLLLLALAMMFAATQCTQSPPPDQEVPDSTQEEPKTSRSECDDTPYEELGLTYDFVDHIVLVSIVPAYGDKVYTVEDFPEIACTEVEVIMVSEEPAPETTWSQWLKLTLATHSKKGVLEAIELLNQREDVEIAEPNTLLEPASIPNDPAYIAGIQ